MSVFQRRLRAVGRAIYDHPWGPNGRAAFLPDGHPEAVRKTTYAAGFFALASFPLGAHAAPKAKLGHPTAAITKVAPLNKQAEEDQRVTNALRILLPHADELKSQIGSGPLQVRGYALVTVRKTMKQTRDAFANLPPPVLETFTLNYQSQWNALAPTERAQPASHARALAFGLLAARLFHMDKDAATTPEQGKAIDDFTRKTLPYLARYGLGNHSNLALVHGIVADVMAQPFHANNLGTLVSASATKLSDFLRHFKFDILLNEHNKPIEQTRLAEIIHAAGGVELLTICTKESEGNNLVRGGGLIHPPLGACQIVRATFVDYLTRRSEQLLTSMQADETARHHIPAVFALTRHLKGSLPAGKDQATAAMLDTLIDVARANPVINAHVAAEIMRDATMHAMELRDTRGPCAVLRESGFMKQDDACQTPSIRDIWTVYFSARAAKALYGNADAPLAGQLSSLELRANGLKATDTARVLRDRIEKKFDEITRTPFLVLAMDHLKLGTIEPTKSGRVRLPRAASLRR